MFDVAANETYIGRTGTIVVAGGGLARTCTVVQAAFVPTLAITPTSTNLSEAAASGLTLGVTANISWTAVTNVAWLAITSGESGSTNGTVVFNVSANEGAATRTGTIVVAGGGLARSCTVVQAAFVPVLSVSPADINLPYGTTNGVTIGVTANVSWTAVTNVPWLAITSGESGFTNGVVIFSAAANEGTAERIGEIVLTGGGLVRTCRVVQAYEGQPAGYEMWASAISNGLTNPLDCAAGDGVPNLLRYATGSPDPMVPDGLSEITWVVTSRVPVLRFNRNPNAVDVIYLVEGTDALTGNEPWRGLATNAGGSWAGATNVIENSTGSPVVCTVTDPVLMQSNRFLRLRVTMP